MTNMTDYDKLTTEFKESNPQLDHPNVEIHVGGILSSWSSETQDEQLFIPPKTDITVKYSKKFDPKEIPDTFKEHKVCKVEVSSSYFG